MELERRRGNLVQEAFATSSDADESELKGSAHASRAFLVPVQMVLVLAWRRPPFAGGAEGILDIAGDVEGVLDIAGEGEREDNVANGGGPVMTGAFKHRMVNLDGTPALEEGLRSREAALETHGEGEREGKGDGDAVEHSDMPSSATLQQSLGNGLSANILRPEQVEVGARGRGGGG